MTTLRPAHSARFYVDAPAWQDADGTRHWVTRGANFVVVATHAAAGAVLARATSEQSDEYMALLPEGTAARIGAGSDTVTSEGDSLAILPPGASTVTLPQGGWVFRIFSRRAADLAGRASNARDYADGASDVGPLVEWPAPEGGFRLRHYRVAEHARSDTTMRLFRSTNLMVNVFLPGKAPRDVRKMTPHSHADFEQGSLALRGSYVHHLRYPWTPDLPAWREDEHGQIGSPSLIVIPPKVIHTSQSVGAPPMQLVDIFSPPRDDFSLKPGLVCNAADYPLPERLRDAAPVNAVA
jgi:mannose-6-phosphate isomerase-like protein (cupin superfamily)